LTTRGAPCATSLLTRAEPMNPAPPVTITVPVVACPVVSFTMTPAFVLAVAPRAGYVRRRRRHHPSVAELEPRLAQPRQLGVACRHQRLQGSSVRAGLTPSDAEVGVVPAQAAFGFR